MGLLKNIQREIKKYKLKQKINEDISKYKYVHIMYNDKFNKPFVDFLNKYFDSNEHMVLCYRSSTDYVARPFPEGKNVYEFIKLDGLNLRAQNIEKIIFHSLFTKGCVDYLYENKDILEKSYWTIWGGDLYNAKRDDKNDFVRKNFKGYISAIKGDELIAKEKYNSDSELFYGPYLPPVTLEMLENQKKESKVYTVIQINNSCDETTLEMLDILSKYKEENIKITTILSYGKLKFKDEIIKKGFEIYGDKFSYLEELISPIEFAKYISDTDILVMNQNRQQGLGNIIASLYFGTKVFVKNDIVTMKYLTDMGFNISNTYDIPKLNFADFMKISEKDRQQNHKISEDIHSEKFYKQQWDKVLRGEQLYVN